MIYMRTASAERPNIDNKRTSRQDLKTVLPCSIRVLPVRAASRERNEGCSVGETGDASKNGGAERETRVRSAERIGDRKPGRRNRKIVDVMGVNYLRAVSCFMGAVVGVGLSL
jgi:hypothetical protein